MTIDPRMKVEKKEQKQKSESKTKKKCEYSINRKKGNS